jgi:hypothetical protein
VKVLTIWKHLALLASILACLCFASCTSGAEKIDRLLETLPTPPNVDLLYEQDGARQGSQDACFFPYTKQLYGTNQSFEQIVAFYEGTLDQAGWRRRVNGLVPPDSPAWEKDKEFWLSLWSDPRLDFPEEVVSDAQLHYETVYFLVVTYADRIAREKCLGQKY